MPYDWILTDFSTLLPVEKAGVDAKPGQWQLVDYRTETFDGVMIMANPDAAAPEIAISLPLQGYYEIYLGFFENYGDRLRVKLSTDRCHEVLVPSQPYGATFSFQDVYWRTLELTGAEQLLITQDHEYRACVGYILARKVDALPQPRHGNRLLHVTDDGYPSNWGRPETHEDQSWLVEPLRRFGADYISLGIDMCGLANYATRHDSLRYPCRELLQGMTHTGEIYRLALDIIQQNIDEGYQVPRRYYELVHQQGGQAFGYSRMAHISAPPPYDTHFSTLYHAHPEYRCVDIGGSLVNRLSYAFPEVRQAFATLFSEQVEMGADGVNMVFVRGLPGVCYEAPVRERFLELHGEDCTRLPEDDPRAQAVRAEFMTTFMREQRQAIDAAAAVQGRAASIIATVPATRAICEFYGLDIPTWVSEGLVDVLCPYQFNYDAGVAKLEMDFFVEAVRGSKITLLPFINTWRDSAESMLRYALELMQWPIDGFSVWDAVSSIDRNCQAVFYSLGDRDAMEIALAKLQTGPTHRQVVEVQGTLVNKYNFGWNF